MKIPYATGYVAKRRYCIDPYDGNACLWVLVERHDKICGRGLKLSFRFQTGFKHTLRPILCVAEKRQIMSSSTEEKESYRDA